jgi:RES domain-containing protein
MGGVKNAWIEAQERGWEEIEDKYACEACVQDEFLKGRVRAAVEANECDYCGRTAKEPIAAPVRVVQEIVGDAVLHFFAEPGESGCPYDGGFIIESTDTEDVLLTLDLNCNDELFGDIKDAFTNDDWIPAANGHWLSLHPNEALRYSWDRFCRWVQHETRFFFSQISESTDDYGSQEIDGRNVLPVIGELVSDLGLISTVPKDSVFYRVRKRREGCDWSPSAETMAAPPSDRSTAGRMNPAGISYLYLAIEELTAIKEIIGKSASDVAVAEFKSVRELKVLDLTCLPKKPSLFDGERRDQREGLIFLGHFVEAITKPVEKDGREHVSYVPSQVVSEFFALVFESGGGIALDGIQYPSAVHQGGRNLVLFPTKRGVNRVFGAVNFNRAYTKTTEATFD